jgi:hypothetical protein
LLKAISHFRSICDRAGVTMAVSMSHEPRIKLHQGPDDFVAVRP